jgi:hypothetical protein
MRPADIITRAVKDTWKPYLLEKGFEADGTQFRRSVGETVQIMGIQRHGVGGAQGFVYLNGIIRLPAIQELLAGVDSRPQPRWEKLAGMLDDVAAHISPETPWRTWLATP